MKSGEKTTLIGIGGNEERRILVYFCNMYRLDRTAFKIQTFAEADNTKEYWLKKTPEERLRASWFLTCAAFGIDYKNPIRLDRQQFSMRKNG